MPVEFDEYVTDRPSGVQLGCQLETPSSVSLMLGPRSSRLIQTSAARLLVLIETATRLPSGERAGQPNSPCQSGSTDCAFPSRVTHTSSCLPCSEAVT